MTYVISITLILSGELVAAFRREINDSAALECLLSGGLRHMRANDEEAVPGYCLSIFTVHHAQQQ